MRKHNWQTKENKKDKLLNNCKKKQNLLLNSKKSTIFNLRTINNQINYREKRKNKLQNLSVYINILMAKMTT